MKLFDLLQAIAMIWLFVSLGGIAFILTLAIATAMTERNNAEEPPEPGSPPTEPWIGRICLPDVDPRPLEPHAGDPSKDEEHIARRLEVVRRQHSGGANE